jgi:hypothetical protein
MLTNNIMAKIGSFVFYAAPNQHENVLIEGGRVTGVSESTVTIHQHRRTQNRYNQFTPLYNHEDGRPPEAKLKPTALHSPIIHTVPLSAIMVTGTITPSNFVDAPTINHLKSTGMILMMQADPDMQDDPDQNTYIPSVNVMSPLMVLAALSQLSSHV